MRAQERLDMQQSGECQDNKLGEEMGWSSYCPVAPQHTETIVCCLTAQKPEITLGKRNIEKEARKGQEEKTTNEKHIEKINFYIILLLFSWWQFEFRPSIPGFLASYSRNWNKGSQTFAKVPRDFYSKWSDRKDRLQCKRLGPAEWDYSRTLCLFSRDSKGRRGRLLGNVVWMVLYFDC